MASSSKSFAVISVAVLLQLLLASASSLTSTKYINALCEHVDDKTFCIQTLNAYPPVASASSKFQVASAVLRLSISYAQKSARLIEEAANKNPNLKNHLEACQQEYMQIVSFLNSAVSELKESPDTSNYDVKVCYVSTVRVKLVIGKNRDMTLKKVMSMTLKMDKLLAIAVGATELVGG